MAFSRKDFELNKKAFRRTWDIDPVQKVVPLKTKKNQDKKVDWQAELEEAANDNLDIPSEDMED